MDLWRRWRVDVARPNTPVGREELRFLVVSTVAVLLAGQLTDRGRGWELGLQAIAGMVLALRAVWSAPPWELVAAIVLGLVGVSVGAHGRLEVGFFLAVLTVLYASWHLGSTTRALGVAVGTALTTVIVALRLDDEINWMPWTAASAFMFVLGRNLRRQGLLIGELEATRSALAEAAVGEERRRIARELHDLAGHTLAAVVLHVTGARHVLRRDLDEAERALLEAERAGRASLDQIRAAVDTLRTTERGLEAPLENVGDVLVLVEEYRRAGLRVDAGVSSAAAVLRGPVGTAVHRIAREALSNVARHAPGNRVDLSIDVACHPRAGEPATVRLIVADHGRRPPSHRRDPAGFGLSGMQERARGLGGELSAGPTDDGWRVQALLPLATTAEAEAGDPR